MTRCAVKHLLGDFPKLKITGIAHQTLQNSIWNTTGIPMSSLIPHLFWIPKFSTSHDLLPSQKQNKHFQTTRIQFSYQIATTVTSEVLAMNHHPNAGSAQWNASEATNHLHVDLQIPPYCWSIRWTTHIRWGIWGKWSLPVPIISTAVLWFRRAQGAPLPPAKSLMVLAKSSKHLRPATGCGDAPWNQVL